MAVNVRPYVLAGSSQGRSESSIAPVIAVRGARFSCYGLPGRVEGAPVASGEEIRGRGLMIGVEIKASSGKARPFCEALAERGILCKETHDQVIRFAPPLVVEKEALEWVVGEAKEVLG